jgi:hypothetical protein
MNQVSIVHDDAVDVRKDMKRFHQVKTAMEEFFRSDAHRIEMAQMAFDQDIFGLKPLLVAAKRRGIRAAEQEALWAAQQDEL